MGGPLLHCQHRLVECGPCGDGAGGHDHRHGVDRGRSVDQIQQAECDEQSDQRRDGQYGIPPDTDERHSRVLEQCAQGREGRLDIIGEQGCRRCDRGDDDGAEYEIFDGRNARLAFSKAFELGCAHVEIPNLNVMTYCTTETDR